MLFLQLFNATATTEIDALALHDALPIYNIDGGAYQASATFAGLAPGNHTLTARLAASTTFVSGSTGNIVVNAVPSAFQCYCDHRDRRSCPTRRSSYL